MTRIVLEIVTKCYGIRNKYTISIPGALLIRDL
jgi:hypothetical protein